MNQFIDYGKVEFSVSGMSMCFSLLNSARTFIRSHMDQSFPMLDASILTGVINHIGTITTHDFQITSNDLYDIPKTCIPIEPNILLNVLWNYGSHYLNAIHPEYQQGDSVLQEQLLERADVSTLQSFINDIAKRNQIDYQFSKEELYQRVYEIQKDKQK